MASQKTKTAIDYTDKCIECTRDTKFGSGLFVNRIPASNDYEFREGKEVVWEHRDGWMCWECQQVECEGECPIGNLTLDYQIVEGTILCPDCLYQQLSVGAVWEDHDSGLFRYLE